MLGSNLSHANLRASSDYANSGNTLGFWKDPNSKITYLLYTINVKSVDEFGVGAHYGPAPIDYKSGMVYPGSPELSPALHEAAMRYKQKELK